MASTARRTREMARARNDAWMRAVYILVQLPFKPSTTSAAKWSRRGMKPQYAHRPKRVVIRPDEPLTGGEICRPAVATLPARMISRHVREGECGWGLATDDVEMRC